MTLGTAPEPSSSSNKALPLLARQTVWFHGFLHRPCARHRRRRNRALWNANAPVRGSPSPHARRHPVQSGRRLIHSSAVTPCRVQSQALSPNCCHRPSRHRATTPWRLRHRYDGAQGKETTKHLHTRRAAYLAVHARAETFSTRDGPTRSRTPSGHGCQATPTRRTPHSKECPRWSGPRPSRHRDLQTYLRPGRDSLPGDYDRARRLPSRCKPRFANLCSHFADMRSAHPELPICRVNEFHAYLKE